MTSPLAQTLHQHLQRSLYSQGQLATLSGVPKNTITNWLSGRVSKPHQWHGLIRVATALRLTAEETDTLLRAAGHPSLAELHQTTLTTPDEHALLAPWASSTPIPFQALPNLPYFVGRDNELQNLRVRLLENARVCLYGMGGVGKTTLAAHLAYPLRPHFPDGVLWAQLDTSDTMTILYTIAKSYGVDIRQVPTLDSRATLVRGLLADKRALLVLDNAENSAQIAPLLPPTTGACAVLVTTRFDLSITDGWPRLELHPFEANTDDSLALFAHFLGTPTPPDTHAALREIANLVGHLPLALAILAARLAQTPNTIPQILTRLREAYGRLGELERDQRSVRASFDISFATLSPELQSFFVQLGAFGGEDFSPEAAAFVTETRNNAANELLRLRHLSLVQDSRDGRYRLHPLLRDYAREKIHSTHHPTAPYTRMIQYYVEWVETLTQAGRAPQAISPATFLPDLSNLVATLDTAHEQKLEEYLPRALHTFFDILYQQGFAGLLEKHLERVIGYTQRYGKIAQQARMSNLFGQVQYWLGRDPLPHYQTALELARRAEDEEVICDALRLLGGHAWRHNQFEESKTKVLEALEIARRLDYPARITELLVNLGAVAFVQKDFQQAERNYRESLALAREIGYHRAQLVILQNLACLLADQDHYPQAVSYFQQGVRLAREHAFRDALMGLLGDWGYRALRHADLTCAEACCQESLALARAMGHSARVATRLSDLGEVARRKGYFQTALTYQEEAHKLAKEANLAPVAPLVALRFANLYADLGQFQRAEESLTQCLLERDALHDEFEGELHETQQRLRPPT